MQCLRYFFTLFFFHQALTAPSNVAPLLFLSTPSSSNHLKCYAGTEGDHLSIDTCSSTDAYCLKFDGDIIDRFGNHYSGEGVGCQESFTPKVAAACTSVGYHKIDVQDGDSYFNGTVYCCNTDLCDPTDDFFLTTTLNPFSPCIDVDSDCSTMSKECTNSLYKPLMCKYCQKTCNLCNDPACQL
jgi:hypothetical protein